MASLISYEKVIASNGIDCKYGGPIHQILRIDLMNWAFF